MIERDEAAIRADERERWKQSHGGLVAEIEREIRAETIALGAAWIRRRAGMVRFNGSGDRHAAGEQALLHLLAESFERELGK